MRIAQERRGNSSSPVFNGNLHYPLTVDIDKPLHDAAADKIREYRADYNNRPLILFLSCLLLIPPLAAFTVFTVRLCKFYFCSLIGKPTAFFEA